MKSFYISVAILFFNSIFFNTVAQIDPTTRGEIRINFENTPPSYNLTLEVTSLSIYWDADNDYSEHYLSDEFDNFDPVIITEESGTLYDIALCWAINMDITLGLGLYKIKIIDGNDETWFNIDYRTSELPECISTVPVECIPTMEPGTIDLTFEYDITNHRFELDGFSVNNSTQYIWRLKDFCCEETDDLQPLPPENLSVTDTQGHPHLTWNRSSNRDDYWNGYKIYREVTPSSIPTGHFILIDEVSTGTTSYTDLSIETGNGFWAHYYVTAINGIMESASSNIATVEVPAPMKRSTNKYDNNGVLGKNKLLQNFPNPFNPSTFISFSIKDDSFVNLKVIDVLGREVASLVNENLSAGNHKVVFDGSNLESGVYFYEIRTDNFRDIKKLLLLK